MAKKMAVGLGALGLVAAGWSGGWHYGESEIRARTQARIIELASQGTAVSYKSLEIEGFPFAYRGKVVEPRAQTLIQTLDGAARADWTTSHVTFDAKVSDFGTVNFSIPDEQKVTVSPLDKALSPVDVVIRSKDFVGSFTRSIGQVSIDGRGEAIEAEVTSPALAPYVVTVKKMSATASAPFKEAGQVDANFDLEGAAVNGDAWDIVDPTQSFPRDPANVRLSAKAQTSLRDDRTIKIDAIEIGRVALDLAGVSLNGDGAATVQDRSPEGAITLRLQGLAGFLGNAARAGFLPENQASLYSAMLDGFAKKSEREGEQVYTVSFKSGFTFVNGAPTFIPAPQLP